MKNIFLLILSLTIFSAKCFTQNNIRLEADASFLSNQSSNTLFSNWKDGWAFGAGLSYRLSDATDFLWEAHYSNLPYKGGNIELAIPAVLGFRWNTEGVSTNFYETSIGLRFATQVSFMRPFLALHAGLAVINVGKITISSWMDSQPQNISKATYQGTGITLTRGYASIGLGSIIPVSQSFAFIAEARFGGIFNTELTTLPISLTAQFNL